MLKVFLVEDEYVMREGIKNNIDWNSHGYEFCGEASDGELAFPMIQKLKPDIVITDIRMPFMDGLVLSKLIKKELPWTEIIILTGYGEFEYAKEAIKIGVAEYLLKPISGDALLKEMDALAAKIEEKKQEREIREKYMKEIEENFLNERKELFQYLVTGSKSVEELLGIAGKLEIDLSALWYNIVLVKVQSMNHAYDEYSNMLVEAERQVRKLAEEMRLLDFDRNPEGRALLFKADSKEELEALQAEYISRLEGIVGGYDHVRYFGGIGMPVNRLGELPGSFEKASRAFAHRYLVGESLFLDSGKMEESIPDAEEEFDIRDVNLGNIDRNKIQEFLKHGERDEVIYFVEEFFRNIDSNALRSNLFRQYITMDAYFSVIDFVEGLQFSRNEIEPPDMASGLLQSGESMMQYVVRIIMKALELREKSASSHYVDIIAQVTQYIERNYSQEDLSLNILASEVNFSPNYLSMIFSQQMGKSFVKYLTDFRMNKAKELLRCTGKRSSEISVEVGYKDPHYFSYLFKKTQGVTPTQYRGKKSEGEQAGERTSETAL